MGSYEMILLYKQELPNHMYYRFKIYNNMIQHLLFSDWHSCREINICLNDFRFKLWPKSFKEMQFLPIFWYGPLEEFIPFWWPHNLQRPLKPSPEVNPGCPACRLFWQSASVYCYWEREREREIGWTYLNVCIIIQYVASFTWVTCNFSPLYIEIYNCYINL